MKLFYKILKSGSYSKSVFEFVVIFLLIIKLLNVGVIYKAYRKLFI